MKFDLMREKPKLDIPTLNWVWDELWRRNHAAPAKNIDGRIRQDERAALMGRLLNMAEDEAGAAYREKGIPYVSAHYDGAGYCLTCGQRFSACTGVHTFEEIQTASRRAQKGNTP